MDVLLERLTWVEVREALEKRYDRVLIMVGSVEQHGPHLPLGTDTVLGYSWGEDVARSLGRTLVAPVVRPGYSSHHLGFPGTLTCSEETLLAVLADTCRSLSESGFRKLILHCSHGGNWPVVYRGAERLQQAVGGHAEIVIPTEQEVQEAEDAVYAFLAEEGIAFREAGVHAGLRETAYMLWVAGEMVRRDTISDGWAEDGMLQRLAQVDRIEQLSPSGILGQPRRATRDLGRRLNRLTVKLYSETISRYL